MDLWRDAERSLLRVQDLEAKALEEGRFLTGEAESDGRRDFGLKREEIFAEVAGLKPADFYKSMESEKRPGLWQDVYTPTIECPRFPGGIEVYCKVQLVDGGLTVISFKTR